MTDKRNTSMTLCSGLYRGHDRSISRAMHPSVTVALVLATGGFLSSLCSRSMITWRWRHDATDRCPIWRRCYSCRFLAF